MIIQQIEDDYEEKNCLSCGKISEHDICTDCYYQMIGKEKIEIIDIIPRINKIILAILIIIVSIIIL